MAPAISMSSPFGSKHGQNLALLASTPNQVNANLYPRTSSAPHLSPTHSSPTRLSPKCLSPTRLSPPRFLFTTSPPFQESPTFPTVSTVQTQTGVVSASTTSLRPDEFRCASQGSSYEPWACTTQRTCLCS